MTLITVKDYAKKIGAARVTVYKAIQAAMIDVAEFEKSKTRPNAMYFLTDLERVCKKQNRGRPKKNKMNFNVSKLW